MKKIALLIILLSTFLFSNFIGMNSGARSLSMGNAFVALSDESTAIFYNPAGLAKVNEFDLMASRENLYGVSDLYNDMIGKIAKASSSVIDSDKKSKDKETNQAFDDMMGNYKMPEEKELNPEDLDIEEVEEDIDISVAYDKDGNEIQTGLTN